MIYYSSGIHEFDDGSFQNVPLLNGGVRFLKKIFFRMVMEMTSIVNVAGYPCEINETFQTKQTLGSTAAVTWEKRPKKPVQKKQGVYDVTVAGAENEISGLTSRSVLNFSVHFHP